MTENNSCEDFFVVYFDKKIDFLRLIKGNYMYFLTCD